MALVESFILSMYLIQIVMLIVITGILFNFIIKIKPIRRDLLNFIYLSLLGIVALAFGMYFSLAENVSQIIGIVVSFIDVLVIALLINLVVVLRKKINLILSSSAIGVFVFAAILIIFRTLNKTVFLILTINLMVFFVIIIFYFIAVNFIIKYGGKK